MKRNMSGEKAASPCNRFQANVFNKSKCQNCFKSRELHLLSDHDKEQAKPIYAGWLCLAPEGTDFDNPMQRSRKWQRRFFILYEHGCLTFALDELPSTLPQGTVNLNLCTDIADAEPRTGQRNALCIVTSEQEIFIRGDNKEIINGWSEQLAVYLRTNKQNQKKKRKVEPVNTQEPSPAKMAATDPAQSGCGRWQEEQQGRGPDLTPIWTVTADTDSQGLEQNPADNTSASLSPTSRDSLSSGSAGATQSQVLDSSANGHTDAGFNKQLVESNNVQSSAHSKNQNQSQDRSCGSRAERIVGLEATETEWGGGAGVSSRGRSEVRTSRREPEKLQSCGDLAQLSAPPPQRRAKSLDRRTSDTVMTPDLLNFKKGWLVKLDKNEQWKKYWFVLSTDTLRYYKDSVTEESSDLEGDIDLTRCYNVSEYQVQRNYGFQIHTWKAVYTLSAMTAGIRKNWIQSLMKNVHPANSPDVTSLPGRHVPQSPPETLPKPDVTQDLSSTDVPIEKDSHAKPKSVMERRREGRYRTFDWAELRPQNRSALENHQKITPPCSLVLGDLERGRRREERRRRYESMLGFSLSWEEAGDKGGDRNVRALSPKSQQRAEEEVEECWKQVERTVFRLDRTVPLVNEARDTVDMEKLLESYRKWVEDLKVQLVESERRRLELEAQRSPAGCQHQQVTPQLDPPLASEADFFLLDKNKIMSNSRAESMREADAETREPLMQTIIRQDVTEQFSLDSSTCQQTQRSWLQDTEGGFQDLGDFLPDSLASPLLSPVSESRHMLSQSDGLNLVGTAANHQRQRVSEDHQLLTSSETQVNITSNSVTLEKPAEGGDNDLIEQDQAAVRRLSHEVELLTSQNEALNQHNQEMLNQLTEADREIERLKAELSSRYTEPHHLPEVEQQGNVRAEDLERELSLRDQELLEAQMLIVALKENLTEKEALLQLNVQTEKEKTAEEKNDQKAEGYLLRCFQATEAKLTELERELSVSETNCRELQTQNAEFKEAEKLFHQRAAELEADNSRLSLELEEERVEKEKKCVSSEERIQQVIDGMVTRLEALGKFLEVIDKLDFGKQRQDEETMPAAVSQLKWEEEFWSSLLNELQVSTSQTDDEKPAEELIREVTELMTVEREILLLGHGLLSERDSSTGEGKEGLKDLDIILDAASVPATETQNIHERSMSGSINQLCHFEQFRTTTQMKISLLKHVAASAPEKVHLIADRLKEFHLSEHLQFGLVHSAATEALYCCHFNQLRSKCEKELQKIKQKRLACDSCVRLKEENTELESRISNLEGQVSSCRDMRNVCCQTDETIPQDPDTEPQATKGTDADTVSEEISQQTLQMPEGEAADSVEETGESLQESKPNVEMKQVLELRGRVTELEEMLLFTVQELTRERDQKMACVQMQHETELEKLKTTCQRGLISMEELHLKLVEELQRRHQQEVERLLVERDQLLEEESAATATAIKAIKNAHRLELEREVQRRCQSGNLEDVQGQHSEELASYQRELQALSQQFSLKCLENGHLFQALDAERKALCQCQQENQDLRTRNQELSGHLAAEITRLCSLAKQDDLPLSQGMDVYEMEITLRVKESEVQCLKQEITSLKDELQSAQRDKRNITKKYKDTFTELSVVRAAAEREMDELRENLRLAHQALDQTSL